MFNFESLKSTDKFINFEKFVKFVQETNKVLTENTNEDIKIIYTSNPMEVLNLKSEKTIAKLFSEDLINFKNFKNYSFLDNQKWKGTKFSYAELKAQIERRCDNFNDSIVSLERVEELSFNYDETTENLVSNKECCICLVEYEIGQKLSRMPCRHFFYKYCILKWFKSTSSSQYDPYDNFEYDDFECDNF